MTKTDIGKILAIIPKTGNADFDEHINQAKIAIAAAPDTPDHIESQPESQILESCIELMQDLTDSFLEWYDFVYGEDAMKNLDTEERFNITLSYFEIVQKLFLQHTHHSGGTSTRQKCKELKVPYDDGILFGIPYDDSQYDEEDNGETE